MTCFHSVALAVGCNRIAQGTRFHYPFGDPELPPEKERIFRKELVAYALGTLTEPIDGPKVFECNMLKG